MDFVESLVEFHRWVGGARTRAEAWAASEAGLFEGAEAVVHVDANMFGLLDAFGFGDFHGAVHSVEHPELGDSDHNGKADGPRVFLGVMVAVEGEVRRGEA